MEILEFMLWLCVWILAGFSLLCAVVVAAFFIVGGFLKLLLGVVNKMFT